MRFALPLCALGLLTALAWCQDAVPTPSGAATRQDVTADARLRFDAFRADVRFHDEAPGRADEDRGEPHTLVVETADGFTPVRDVDTLLRFVERLDTEARALAFARFLSDPPAGPPLVPFVELKPRLELGEALWYFSPIAVRELGGDGPRVTRDAHDGFFVERVVIDPARLPSARALEPVKGQLAPEQADALEADGATLHVLQGVWTAHEHVLPGRYTHSLAERPVRLFVVRRPLPVNEAVRLGPK